MNEATKALLEKEIMDIERFDQIFGEWLREILSCRSELFEHNEGKLPFYPLEQLRDIVTEGDILIGIYEWADANNYFGIADYTLNEAIFPVFKGVGESYVLIDGSYAPVRKLNYDNYIVVPKLRDFDKEISKLAEIRKRLREIDQEIKALNKERIALYNEL